MLPEPASVLAARAVPGVPGSRPGGGWRGLRDRLLGSARFRRLAAALPLTRSVARRRARALFDLCAGFVYSQVLLACVRLDLFETLRAGPLEVSALATRLRLPAAGARRLFAAAVSLQLLERRRGGRIGLGPLGAALLDNPGVAAMVEHHAMLYGDLADPLALLRGERRDTALNHYWPYAGSDAPAALETARVREYSALMSASQGLVAEEVLAAYPLRRHRRLLDVGGGDGSFLAAAAARAPSLALELFDLPAVVALARERLQAAGLTERVSLHGGDFRHAPLPAGADLITLVRVLHDHDDATVTTLLAAAHEALAAGGTLLVAEPMAATPGAEPMGDAYFGLYLLAMGSGRPRSPAELEAALSGAGFVDIRRLDTRLPLQTGVIRARHR